MNPLIAYTPEDIDMNTPDDKIIHHEQLARVMINIRVEDDPGNACQKMIDLHHV